MVGFGVVKFGEGDVRYCGAVFGNVPVWSSKVQPGEVR